MLTVLAAFLVNNVLVVWFGFPGLRGIGAEGGGTRLGQPRCSTPLPIAARYRGGLHQSPNRSLRWDAHLVHRFNVYLIRALFWSIFLVGLFDASIAFLRAEASTCRCSATASARASPGRTSSAPGSTCR